MQSSPASRHFLPLRSKYSPQHPVLNIIHACKYKAYNFITIHDLVCHEISNRILMCCHMKKKSQDSSVGIALGYGLDDRGSRVRFLAGAGNFSLHHRVQNGSGAHPASYPMGTRGSFPGDKAAGAWSWPLTSI
jgi:hypothetical protein